MDRTDRFTWRNAPDLMARLTTAQNHPANENRDVMTFAGMCDSRAELERHVLHCEDAATRWDALRGEAA